MRKKICKLGGFNSLAALQTPGNNHFKRHTRKCVAMKCLPLLKKDNLLRVPKTYWGLIDNRIEIQLDPAISNTQG